MPSQGSESSAHHPQPRTTKEIRTPRELQQRRRYGCPRACCEYPCCVAWNSWKGSCSLTMSTLSRPCSWLLISPSHSVAASIQQNTRTALLYSTRQLLQRIVRYISAVRCDYRGSALPSCSRCIDRNPMLSPFGGDALPIAKCQ